MLATWLSLFFFAIAYVVAAPVANPEVLPRADWRRDPTPADWKREPHPADWKREPHPADWKREPNPADWKREIKPADSKRADWRRGPADW